MNERPPARDTKVVSEEEQAKIERDLATAREAQAQQAAQVKKDRAGMLAVEAYHAATIRSESSVT